MCGETKRPTLYLDWSVLAVFSATDPLPLDPAMCITDTFGCRVVFGLDKFLILHHSVDHCK
jgi:hypothetical protein